MVSFGQAAASTERIPAPFCAREMLRPVEHWQMKWGLDIDLNRAEEAYFHTKILSPEQYASMLRLLTIFGQHLSMVSNQLSTQLKARSRKASAARANSLPGTRIATFR